MPDLTTPQEDDAFGLRLGCADEAPVLLTLTAGGSLNQWRHATVDLTAYAGKILSVSFFVMTDANVPTTFRVDDVSILACGQ